MSKAMICPDCGSTRVDAYHESSDAVSQSNRNDVWFAQVLNGRQWREKPVAPPRDRDDVVPSD